MKTPSTGLSRPCGLGRCAVVRPANRNAHLRRPLFADLEIGPPLDVLRDGHE